MGSLPNSTVTLRELIERRLFKHRGRVSRERAIRMITLDTPLTFSEIRHFYQIIEGITPDEHSPPNLALCSACNLPRFVDIRRMGESTYLSEIVQRSQPISLSLQDFHLSWGMTSCCHAVISGINDKWWYDIVNSVASPEVPCPMVGCEGTVPLHYDYTVSSLSEEIGIPDNGRLDRCFEHAKQLRIALRECISGQSITRDEMQTSIALYNRLHDMLYMRSFVPSPFRPRVELVDIETSHNGKGTRIPFFTHLLLPRIAKNCMVCGQAYLEFKPGNSEVWARAIEGFEGDWTWQILDFPTTEVLPECQHTFEICRACIATHIEVQLSVRGRSAVQDITCPSPNCNHKFTYTEVRRLAASKTFASYDRLVALHALSALPNFRWCLREGCSSGGLCDIPVTPSTQHPEPRYFNQIVCNNCGFGICFSCQVPWHINMTCEEYASQREHGDPQFNLTQAWIKTNTKLCPGDGCGVPVEKGAGCFHMTCRQCGHEFCWECLASWDGIFVDGVFVRTGHAEGCYFRRRGVAHPTQVLGTDLEAGLRMLGGAVLAGED
ncbi:hypothetical protein F5Y19DRAFT_488678 [Xylariaceae sp. FL1651]|nr:hypothetical protein F5Y19DRAFT_488678 [Xylariaceae sp. FL1651]